MSLGGPLAHPDSGSEVSDPLLKRESFARKLRDKKRKEIIKEKKIKILQGLEKKKKKSREGK